MSAKELGMIHSSEYTYGVSSADNNSLVGPTVIDLPRRLSEQLQRQVRQGNYFKVVGIDIGLSPSIGTSGSVTGYLRYFAPTKGRCAAYRQAFKAMADLMKTQGVSMRDNHQYDFRVALSNNPALTATFASNATLDGTNGLALAHATVPGASVFDVYNESINPTSAALASFSEGFDTILASGAAKTDFVLADTNLFSGNEDFASVVIDKIPFQLSYGPNDTTVSFQWRPDPALYVAVMCGLFEVFIEDCTSPTNLELDITIMTSGWKSIMGNPNKKARRSRKKKKA